MKKRLESISQNQLIKKLKRERDIDYLAIVTSSWHYLSAISTIMWLKEKKNVKKGIILVSAHPTDGHLIDQQLLNTKWFEDMEIYDFRFGALASEKEVRDYLLRHSAFGRPFYILKPVIQKIEFTVLLYNLNVRKNIVHIMIEEGLATYMRDWKGWVIEEMRSNSLNEFWKQLSLRTWKKSFAEHMLSKRGEFIENTLYVKRNNGLRKNKRSIYYFKKTFERLSGEFDFSDYRDYSGSVIICTQPYGEQGRIVHNADIKAIQEICAYMKKEGYHVILKPHPREKYLEKYEGLGCRIDLKNEVPIETVLAGISPKPAYIVGITTTTLITAKLFWNIPALSLAKIIERDSYMSKFVREIDNFCEIFADIVEIPEQLNDLENK